MNKIHPVLVLTVAIAIASSGYPDLLFPANALPSMQSHTMTAPNLVAQTYFTAPPPPPYRGAPGSRGEGASRSECLVGNSSLMAIVPLYQSSSSQSSSPQSSHPQSSNPQSPQNGQAQVADIAQVWGLTVSDRPSFWFYLPYKPEQIRSLEFVLQTAQDETLVRLPVAQPTSSGILQVKLPATAPAIEPNQQYHWFFKVRVACQTSPQATAPVPASANAGTMLDYVEGWIERSPSDPTLSDRTVTPASLAKAKLYAQHGIWYDALTTLAELRRAHPSDTAIATDWQDLLQSIGLESLANQTIVQ